MQLLVNLGSFERSQACIQSIKGETQNKVELAEIPPASLEFASKENK